MCHTTPEPEIIQGFVETVNDDFIGIGLECNGDEECLDPSDPTED